jgi:CDGSH-type Zn-finger protein
MEHSNQAENMPVEKRIENPIEVEVKAGVTYYWCTCGRSSNQPFCDGSHSCTDIAPIAFTAEKDEVIKLCDRFFLCNCGKTSTPPFCDGKHKSFN